MCRALRHRGPDDEGIYSAGGLALGARRLSIIDLGDGHQPRGNEDGTIWGALNGEIYNHPAIRERLERAGHTLKGRSDTETLSHLYEEYGDDLVHVIEGMYAFAIWDSRRQRLLVVRDRFGEKPLFYAREGRELIFASELTALVEGMGSTPDINPAALDAFFVLGYVPGAEGSILQGVEQLPPGHLMVWERETGELTVRPYWSPAKSVTRVDEDPAELAAETRHLLERSVQGRLLSDVPLGVFLSGGLDSTVVAAVAAQLSTSSLKTFTVGYEAGNEATDERSAAREMAELIGSEHHEIVLDSDQAAARIPSLLAGLDVPLADTAVVPLHSVSEFARNEVTVALGGEGADELFGGYPRYAWLERSNRGWRGEGRLGAALGSRVRGVGPGTPRLRRAIDLAVPRSAAERHLDWVTAGRRHARAQLYGPRLRSAVPDEGLLAGLRAEFDESRSHSVAGSLMRFDQLHWLPDDVLVKADRAGMLTSLEVRTAYLNRELAEFAATVAPSVHLAGGGKNLLRMLLSELLPDAPKRRKAAFLPPIGAWLAGPLGPIMAEQVYDGSLYTEGWVDGAAVGRALAEHRRGVADRSHVLWPLLAAGLWLDRFRGRDGR